MRQTVVAAPEGELRSSRGLAASAASSLSPSSGINDRHIQHTGKLNLVFKARALSLSLSPVCTYRDLSLSLSSYIDERRMSSSSCGESKLWTAAAAAAADDDEQV